MSGSPVRAAGRPVRSAGAATVIAVAILLGLGVWQLQRRDWKAGILAEIDHAEASAPVQLVDPPGRFAKVIAHGSFRREAAFYGAEVRDGPAGESQLGAHLLQVLDRQGAAPVLVDRGWVPLPSHVAQPRSAPPPMPGEAGAGEVVGYARPPEHAGFLSAEDDVTGLHFYTLDPAVIGPALGAPNVAPFTLVALGSQTGGFPIPAEALPRPPNNHLQYAFTWFGLAASLIGVFIAWARGQRRQ